MTIHFHIPDWAVIPLGIAFVIAFIVGLGWLGLKLIASGDQ